MSENARIAVVGSGPGGAVAACLLAEAGRDVLLIEEGPRLDQDCCRPFSVAEMVQKYRHGGVTAALGPSPVAYVEARAVGGGSEVNSALYLRAPGPQLEEWSRGFRVEGLGERDLAPHFEALEADLAVAADSSGDHPAGLKLAAGARALGLECRQALRMAAPGGGALRRRAMSNTFVPRALKSGCRLLERTKVLRLRRRAGRWVLEGRTLSSPCEIEVEQVFLACGAIQTPALLRRSGLTRRAGASLALHPMVKLVAEFDAEVNGPDSGVAAQQVKPEHGRFSFGCSIGSPGNLALNLLDHAEPLSRLARDWRRMAAYYVMVPGDGAGEVRHLPGCADPLVRYRASSGEMSALGEGLRLLAELLTAAGARKVHGATALPTADARLMTLHLMGSCPMGEDRERCVADSFGKVHGCAGLYLADASLFCGPLGVNPQATVMALARRNALAFLKAA